jgi:hypothetical protein
MSTLRSIAGVALVVLLVSAVHADPTPTTARIVVPMVEVRSGPSMSYYATSRVYMGEVVTVIGDEDKGWLAIQPPRPGYDSFSWINVDSVVVTQSGMAAIVKVPEAPLRVGSRLYNAPPTVERFKAKQGTCFGVLGRPETSADGTWLPVEPAPQEVRYIPVAAIRKDPPSPQLVAATTVSPPSYTQPRPPVTPLANASPTYASSGGAPTVGRLTSYTPPPRNTTPQYSNTPDTSASVRLSPPSVSATPTSAVVQWYEPGYLSRTMLIDRDGRQLYRIEPASARGAASDRWAYVSAAPGLSLEPFVGRDIAIYGQMVYRTDLRYYHLTATQVNVAR